MTLALPKVSLLMPQAEEYVGELWLADISVPRELYRRIGIQVGDLFAAETIVRLR